MTKEEAIEVYNGLINPKIKEAFEFFAPELRESENERIRKKCIELIKRVIPSGNNQSSESKDILDCISYLEKQKERLTAEEKMKHPLYVEGFEAGKQVGAQYEAVFGKQKEQNHDGKKWIFEDEYQKDLDRLYNEGKDEVLNNPAKYGLQKEQKPVLAPERIRPKFAVGDTVCRSMWSDHTIREIYIRCNDPVYVCVNEEGTESHILMSEQDEWERKEQKPIDIDFVSVWLRKHIKTYINSEYNEFHKAVEYDGSIDIERLIEDLKKAIEQWNLKEK